jgi:hypothetical protein
LLDGEKSRSVKVKSGVPQGTVLGSLMFLLYINDIGENIGSSVRLFADDSLIYMAVSSRNDCQRLQDVYFLKSHTLTGVLKVQSYKAEVGLPLDICGTSA